MAKIAFTINSAKSGLVKRFLLSRIERESTQPVLDTDEQIFAAFENYVKAAVREQLSSFSYNEKLAQANIVPESTDIS